MKEIEGIDDYFFCNGVRVGLASTQICSACLSLIASSCIVIMICRCPRGLSSPYRRIICMMSVSDVLQSLAIATGPFAVPRDDIQTMVEFGVGTIESCEANGLAMVFGAAAVPMYTCLLCYYYYCKLKKNMTDANFHFRVERKAHIGILFWNLAACTAGICTDNINPSPMGNLCSFSAAPAGCISNNDIVGDCQRGANSPYYIIICLFIVPFLSFVGVLIISARTICHAINLGNMHRHGPEHQPQQKPPLGDGVSDHHGCSSTNSTTTITKPGEFRKNENEIPVKRQSEHEHEHEHEHENGKKEENNYDAADVLDQSNTKATATTKITSSSKRSLAGSYETCTGNADVFQVYKREIMLQAILYAVSFVLVYSNIFCQYFVILSHQVYPMFLAFVLRFFYPLGGFLNIMIWARPNVVQLQQRYPGYSYFHALYLVLQAGGVVPDLSDHDHQERCSLSPLSTAKTIITGLCSHCFFLRGNKHKETEDEEQPQRKQKPSQEKVCEINGENEINNVGNHTNAPDAKDGSIDLCAQESLDNMIHASNDSDVCQLSNSPSDTDSFMLWSKIRIGSNTDNRGKNKRKLFYF